MSEARPFVVVNAFAESPFGGNPAGVFPRADGLTAVQMQAIAKQLKRWGTLTITPPTL